MPVIDRVTIFVMTASCFIEARCKNGWTRFDNSCYLFSDVKLNSTDAEQFCNKHGGHLAHIETQTENDNLRNYCIHDLHDARRWIGLSYPVTEGRWVWHGTDTEIVFNDWGSDEPNHAGNDNCAILWDRHQYHWPDEPCNKLYEPICEAELNSDVGVVG